MSELVFLSHIPLLRIEEETLAFQDGYLWQLPFETYDALSLGAFTDHRKEYEKTSPVFYQIELDLHLPILQDHPEGDGVTQELKIPSNNWALLDQLGLRFINVFHESVVDRAWAALLLAAPGAALPSPRLSTTFIVSTGNKSFGNVGGNVCKTIRVQGDADQEYLFLSEATGPPLQTTTIERASLLLGVVDEVKQHVNLAAALSSLLATTSPLLSPIEQSMLSVIALEAILLPEVKSGLGATFAHRMGRLLALDPKHFAVLKRVARGLYDSRSASLHGGAQHYHGETENPIELAYGQQFLAASIEVLARKVGEGVPLEHIRSQLDDIPSVLEGHKTRLPLTDPAGLRPTERLCRSWTPITTKISSAATMHAAEGTIISWSPLIGLSTDGVIAFDSDDSPVLMPLDSTEVISLEEKDISRDFIAQLPISGHTVAGLVIAKEIPDGTNIESATRMLLRMRDLGVIALRLSGFSSFHDPELLGSYVYEGMIRYRYPTVLRQTLLSMLREEPKEHFGMRDLERLAPAWRLLAAYEATARNSEIDHVLTMFRRVFDRRFLPIGARAGLLLSALEAMLGRFRPPRTRVQLEDLVAYVTDVYSPAATWFEKQGRQFRNAIAHGYWEPERDGVEPLDHLLEILWSTVPFFVQTWIDLDDHAGRRPGRVLIDHVTDKVLTNKRH